MSNADSYTESIMSLTRFGDDQIARRLYHYDATCKPVPHPNALTEADVWRYHEDGFLAVENVFSPEAVQAAIAGLSHLIAGGNPNYKGVQFESGAEQEGLSRAERELFVRKLMGFVDFEERLAEMSRHPVLIEITERLIGDKVNLIQDMALLKPPLIGTEKPWHQDMAYFLVAPIEGIIGTWTALDPATPANGCMHLIPGSHLSGPKAHYHDRDCQLPDEVIEVERDVMVPLSPGGVLFFSALVHHGTPPNSSEDRRRALQFHYASAHCEKILPEQHEELFRDAAGYAGCAGWSFGVKARPVNQRAES
jgi:phytanoyl-CoA hydroxylase